MISARAARSLHLHDDVLAGRQGRAVHLRDRTGGERLGVDALEHVVPGDAQLLLHHLDHLRLGERRHVVAQRGELVDVLRRHEVGTSGEHLAELAEGRAELFEGLAEVARRLAGLRAVVVALAPGEQLGDAVLGDDARDLGGPAAEQQLVVVLGLGRDDGRGLAVERGRVDRDHGARRGMGDAVRHVAEEELLVPAHPRVADHDDVGVLLGRDRDDGLGGLVVDDDPGPAARAGDPLGELVELGAGGVEDVLVDAVFVVVADAVEVVVGWDDDLHEEELGGEPVGEVGRPLDGTL